MKGFSLIEALVALAIAALSFIAIFELQDQMTRGQLRLERTLEAAELQRNAIELLYDVNPMEAGTGERRLASGPIVRWTSTPLTEPVRNAGFPLGDGVYDVALYKLDVVIETEGGRPLGTLAFERMGWRGGFTASQALNGM